MSNAGQFALFRGNPRDGYAVEPQTITAPRGAGEERDARCNERNTPDDRGMVAMGSPDAPQATRREACQSQDSQKGRILKLLEGGEWVPAYKLADVALQYNARIHGLRKAGYVIENRTREVDGQTHSEYRWARE